MIYRNGEITWTDDQVTRTSREQQELAYATVVHEHMNKMEFSGDTKIVVREDRENIAVFFEDKRNGSWLMEITFDPVNKVILQRLMVPD